MKKLIFFSAVTMALLGASCTQDDSLLNGNDGMTSLSVRIPGDLGSRYGEAATTPKLYVAIYKHVEPSESSETTTQTPLFSNFPGSSVGENGMEVGTFSEAAAENNIRTAVVNVPLVKNMAYDIVCWAQREGVTDYTFDEGKQQITVTYGNNNIINNYAEERDAFFGKQMNFTSQGQGADILLTRPFAQINVGASDWDKYTLAGGDPARAFGLTIAGVSNVLNLTTGAVTESTPNETKTITVTPAATTANSEAFPVGTDNKYLAMAYVLANQNLNVTLDGLGNYPAWSSVPVKANYRTNIFGTLLTNAEDFTITLNPIFNEDDNNYDVDKEDEEEPSVPEITPEERNILGDLVTVYPVRTADNFEWLMQNLADNTVAKSSYIVLDNDVDMTDKTVTMVDNFTGTFDGQEHTISNLALTDPSSAQSKARRTAFAVKDMAMFQSVAASATIKNLTIANSEFINTSTDKSSNTASIAAILSGTLENCHNINTNVSGIESVGGLVGRALVGSAIYDCTNSGNISSTRYSVTSTLNGGNLPYVGVGGIVGTLIPSQTGTDNSKLFVIENCENTGSISGVVRDITGGIVGAAPINCIAKILECTNKGTIGGDLVGAAGGIVGSRAGASAGVFTISRCNNTGAVTAKSNTYTYNRGPLFGIAGGIYGGSYINTETINIDNCNNSGIVTASFIAGGIAGGVGNSTIADCINTAAVTSTGADVPPSLSSGPNSSNKVNAGFAGGVVGLVWCSRLNNCQGGSAAITSNSTSSNDNAVGRIAAVISTGQNSSSMCYMTLTATGNDYSSIGTVGMMGWRWGDYGYLTIRSGEFVGNPRVGYGKSLGTITIASGATWQGKTDPVGTYKYGNYTWTKQ